MDAVATGAPVTLNIPADGVALLQMCEPATHNSLNAAMVHALIRMLQQAANDSAFKVLVLSGLPDTFCAGASREVLDAVMQGMVPLAELDLPRHLLQCPIPVIAAMEGAAVGGGFALGLGADVIMLAAESRYGFNFTDLGLSPGMGTTFLAREALGRAVADELMYSAEFRRGRDLSGAPGINAVLPRAAVLARAVDVAMRIADKPRAVVTMLKETLTKDRLSGFHNARLAECEMHQRCLTTAETGARIRSRYAG